MSVPARVREAACVGVRGRADGDVLAADGRAQRELL